MAPTVPPARAGPTPARFWNCSSSNLRSRNWRRRSTCRSIWSTLSGACRRACRCRGSRPIPTGSRRSRPPDVRPCASETFRSTGPTSGCRCDRPPTSCVRYEAHRSRGASSRSWRSARDGDALQPLVSAVVRRDLRRRRRRPDAAPTRRALRPNLDQVLALAIRPFLARSAEALMQRADFSGWQHRPLPVLRLGARLRGRSRRAAIGGSFAAAAPRSGRSAPTPARSARTTTASQITSFATRDGRYRVYACDMCRRYLKAYDGRNAYTPRAGRGRHDRHAAARRRGHAARLRMA